jgi:hypothetical protein
MIFRHSVSTFPPRMTSHLCCVPQVVPALPCVELKRYNFPSTVSLLEEVGHATGVTMHSIGKAPSRSSLGGSGRLSPATSMVDDSSILSSTASSDFVEAVVDTSRGLNVMITARFVTDTGPVRRRNVRNWFGGLLFGTIKQHCLVMPTLDYLFRYVDWAFPWWALWCDV